ASSSVRVLSSSAMTRSFQLPAAALASEAALPPSHLCLENNDASAGLPAPGGHGLLRGQTAAILQRIELSGKNPHNRHSQPPYRSAARVPPSSGRNLDCITPSPSRRPVPDRGRSRASRELSAGAIAAVSVIPRTPDRPGRRQGGRRHGRGCPTPRPRRLPHAREPGERARGDPPRLRPTDATAACGRGGPTRARPCPPPPHPLDPPA